MYRNIIIKNNTWSSWTPKRTTYNNCAKSGKRHKKCIDNTHKCFTIGTKKKHIYGQQKTEIYIHIKEKKGKKSKYQ